MIDLIDLVQRHRVDPGPLVHVGSVKGSDIAAYYDAGYTDMTVIQSSAANVRTLRNWFPGVDAREVTGEQRFRLDAVSPAAHTVVIGMPGHELAVLEFAPWDSMQLLVVSTTANDNAGGPSSYDLVVEAVTTRGFVEVGSWWNPHDGTDVAFIRVAD